MSARRLRRALTGMLLALVTEPSQAQPTAMPTPASRPASPAASSSVSPSVSSRFIISVLTFGPGDAIFERYGHNAIRVRDTVTGSDLAYNWGMFSFDDPSFLRRFLSGETRYWVAAFPSQPLIAAYQERDRATEEQVLALSPTQAEALALAVARNALPENREYRYDYFRDNCSTRVRDALDVALGGILRPQFTALQTDLTYRSESRRLSAPDPFAQAGIELALGPMADTRMTAWETMFIPMRLRDHLRSVTVATAAGAVPLVAAETVHYVARRPAERTEPGGLIIGPLGPVLAMWGLLLIPLTPTMRRRSRIPAAILTGGWFTLTGLVGVLLLGMWLGSAHVFWYRNLTVLLASPVALVVAIPAARAILAGQAPRWVRMLLLLIAAQSMLALVLWPIVAQRLAGPLLLLLGANVALVMAALRHATDPAPR
ncbi:MAG: DUF4105 domain-containing protein [Gemmatimonadetes bacterium]|nr:DUF4105 domain-containing protein [Gemmatimonadota bacterium]